ncbi:MAG: hypothetical protein ACLRRG_07255 [Barnesiella sp.]
MKILLGEASNFTLTLAEGLRSLGYQVTVTQWFSLMDNSRTSASYAKAIHYRLQNIFPKYYITVKILKDTT